MLRGASPMYVSQGILRIIKSWVMRWDEHATCALKKGNARSMLV